MFSKSSLLIGAPTINILGDTHPQKNGTPSKYFINVQILLRLVLVHLKVVNLKSMYQFFNDKLIGELSF